MYIFDALTTLLWPAAAAVSLAMAVGRGDPDPAGALLLACGTATAYGLDRWLDQRESESKTFRRLLLSLTLLAMLLGGFLALTSWWRFQICVVLGLISGAYIPLKKVIPKNILTSAAWTLGACTLPFQHPPALHHAYWGSVFCVYAIMVANTVLSDIPDVAEDREAGVLGIAPRFGAKAGRVVVLIAGSLGFGVGIATNHLPLAITAGALGMIGLCIAKTTHAPFVRKVGDLAVTLLPGPLSLLFSTQLS